MHTRNHVTETALHDPDPIIGDRPFVVGPPPPLVIGEGRNIQAVVCLPPSNTSENCVVAIVVTRDLAGTAKEFLGRALGKDGEGLSIGDA